ncbi:MAG: hypothetical protein GY759_05065 [Chloroflexi bacterium]|nr:hypothetical protein [Chloroflexota bacterium]
MTQTQVAAYYFPGYHVDRRNKPWHGTDWTEWQLVRSARPRFPGHEQPKIPLWGYEDESDPAVFARKIDAAADHAIDAFIFDWYWYGNAPYLQRALEEGYLKAPNNERLRFALMWANHDWVNIFPARYGQQPELMFAGAVSLPEFEKLTDYVIESYFNHPAYWKIDGCPYFSIYELYRLVAGLGGVQAAAEALRGFRERTRRAGYPDIHLNAVLWGVQILPNEQSVSRPAELVTALGFQSVTSYVCIHHIQPASFPTADYATVMGQMCDYWVDAQESYTVSYIPNVTMGWDSSPRTEQTGVFIHGDYPYIPILSGNTPSAFEASLRRARDYLGQYSAPPILTINAWNEWSEGSYLEPDTRHGMAYLEAIRSVFRDS